jgi:methylated-DNA-[protein]-cysteine S-methyltransferase
MSYVHQKITSPVGPLHLVADERGLHVVTFESMWPFFKKRFDGLTEASSPLIERAKKQLAGYFSGKRRSFDLPLKLSGTPFQNRAWSALAEIPFGETATYKEQAKAIQSPRAVRAVGRTNALNPLCIVLPCHRVIGSNGALTGFAGGLKAKKFLLNLEREPSGPSAVKMS